MPHDVSLIATIAAGFGLALVLGYGAMRLKMPPLVGYLLAGVVVGPATPGFVADVGLAGQLAEIGVMLLMYGVGLHFSMDDLMAVRRIAVPGALVQIGAATLAGLNALPVADLHKGSTVPARTVMLIGPPASVMRTIVGPWLPQTARATVSWISSQRFSSIGPARRTGSRRPSPERPSSSA